MAPRVSLQEETDLPGTRPQVAMLVGGRVPSRKVEAWIVITPRGAGDGHTGQPLQQGQRQRGTLE